MQLQNTEKLRIRRAERVRFKLRLPEGGTHDLDT